MRGNAVRQFEKSPQPGQLAATVEGNVVPALGAGDHGADRDHQDVGQRVLDLAAARIRNRPEMSHQPLDGHDPLLVSRREDHLPPGNLSAISFHALPLFPNRGAWLSGGLCYQSGLMREPWVRCGAEIIESAHCTSLSKTRVFERDRLTASDKFPHGLHELCP